MNGTYTWLAIAEDRATGDRLLRRAGALRQPRGALPRSRRWCSSTPSPGSPAPSADKNFTTVPAEDVTNDGYVKWDAGVTVTPWQHLSLVARVENLLDSEYEEVYGFPALGRTFWGGVSVKF